MTPRSELSHWQRLQNQLDAWPLATVPQRLVATLWFIMKLQSIGLSIAAEDSATRFEFQLSEFLTSEMWNDLVRLTDELRFADTGQADVQLEPSSIHEILQKAAYLGAKKVDE